MREIPKIGYRRLLVIFQVEDEERVAVISEPGNQKLPVEIDQGADKEGQHIGRPVAELVPNEA